MATITAAMVKELREITGAAMMDCKRALVENDGDIDKAVEYLQVKGMAKAAKKSGRVAAEGLVATAHEARPGWNAEQHAGRRDGAGSYDSTQECEVVLHVLHHVEEKQQIEAPLGLVARE